MKRKILFLILPIHFLLPITLVFAQPGTGWGDPIFDEEFDGSTINAAMWRDLTWDEYKAENTSVSNDMLIINNECTGDGSTYGGRVDTWGIQTFRYGYYEIRCRTEYKARTTWPAAWLGLNANNTELDLFEWFHHSYDDGMGPNQSHHFKDDRNIIVNLHDSIDPSDWHTYAVLWTPSEISFYVDGQFHYSSPAWAEANDEIYLLLTSSPDQNLTTHSPGDSYPDFYVDYVRIWQKADYSTTVGEYRPPCPVPGFIEGEDFTMPYGIQNVGCSEGGLAVGYLDTGDWLKYNVSVFATGTYQITFRMATASSGSVKVYVDNVIQTSLSIGNTGGWQNWRDFSTQVQLPQGEHELKLQATGSWNLNNMEITLVQTGLDDALTTGGSVQVYPNPTADKVFFANLPEGNYTVRIANLDGKIVRQFNAQSLQYGISLHELLPGMYCIQLMSDTYSSSYRIVKSN